jgi:hypothetical protein
MKQPYRILIQPLPHTRPYIYIYVSNILIKLASWPFVLNYCLKSLDYRSTLSFLEAPSLADYPSSILPGDFLLGITDTLGGLGLMFHVFPAI